jgi:hypothetical protein
MAKYKISFDLAKFLSSFAVVTDVTMKGDLNLEIAVTTTRDLTTTEISNVTKKLPFIEVTKIE